MNYLLGESLPEDHAAALVARSPTLKGLKQHAYGLGVELSVAVVHPHIAGNKSYLNINFVLIIDI